MDAFRQRVIRLRAYLVLLALAALGGGLLLASGCSPQQVQAASGAANTLEDGKRLYQANCANCHGDKGDRLPISPLNSKEFLDSRGDATLVAVMSDGKGTMPASGKARGGTMSDEEIRAVLAYMSQAVGRTTTALQAGTGRLVFQQNCTRCHGDKGDRIPVAPLSAKAFIDSRTDAQFLEIIGNGKGLMPAFAKDPKTPLKQDQITSVVAFLRYSAEANLADQTRRGRELYLNACLSCHGERGDAVPDVKLAAPDYLRKLGEGAVITAISDGKGTMPGSSRGRGGTLDVPEVASLISYLKAWAGLPAGTALSATTTNGIAKGAEPADIFARNCAACHGQTGDRVANVRLKDRQFLESRTDESLTKTITRGNTRGMPAWGQEAGGPLSEADVKQLVAYLRLTATGTARPATPALTTAVAAGDAAKGKELFNSTCAVCHGETRDKVPQARLFDGSWLKERGDATLLTSITNGKGAMPAWGKERGGPLNPSDIANALAYLNSAADVTRTPAAPTAKPSTSPTAAPAPTSGAAPATVTAVAPVAGAAAQTTNAAPSGNPAKGKELIAAKGCGACHKVPGVAGAVGAVGPDLKDVGSRPKIAGGAVSNNSQADLKKWIMDPPAAKPGTVMPKVGLSDSEADDVAAYLRSPEVTGSPPTGGGGSAPSASVSGGAAATPPPDPSAADPTVPSVAVNAQVGLELFKANCAACHGQNGLQQPQCPLGSSEWLSNMPEDALQLRISNGKPGAGMPAWSKRKGGPLSDSQIQAIMQYLPALAQGNAQASGSR